MPDPALADPDPARSPRVPADQAEFLAAYQGRQAEMVRFLSDPASLPSAAPPPR